MKAFLPFILVFILAVFPVNAEEPAFTLRSSAFKEGESIPAVHTCDDKNTSPALQWSGAPAQTQSFALLMEDSDGIGKTPWIHWVLFNLPPTIQDLPQGLPAWKILMNGEKNGRNDFATLGYAGPCAPEGEHHYLFRLYALDNVLALSPGAEKESLLKAIEGHILAQADLHGKYRRSPKASK